jgi:hypothetical protein
MLSDIRRILQSSGENKTEFARNKFHYCRPARPTDEPTTDEGKRKYGRS